MKRAFDILCSAAALLVLSPLLLIVWLAVMIDSRGPGLYRQERIGLNGRTFLLYKFRTMRFGSDKNGSHQTDENDPRVTRLGLKLRRSSIDELPQLWNVLIGEMSIVGPRPDVLVQQNLYSPEQFAKRQSVRPGLTGLAQCRGRNSCTLVQRTRYDLFYASHAHVGFDLQIIRWTIAQLKKGSF